MIYRLNLKCQKDHEAIVTEIHFDLHGNFVFTAYFEQCRNEYPVTFDYFIAVLQNSEMKES